MNKGLIVVQVLQGSHNYMTTALRPTWQLKECYPPLCRGREQAQPQVQSQSSEMKLRLNHPGCWKVEVDTCWKYIHWRHCSWMWKLESWDFKAEGLELEVWRWTVEVELHVLFLLCLSLAVPSTALGAYLQHLLEDDRYATPAWNKTKLLSLGFGHLPISRAWDVKRRPINRTQLWGLSYKPSNQLLK